MRVARRQFALGLSAFALTLTVGCSARKLPSRVETILANTAKDVVIHIEAEGK